MLAFPAQHVVFPAPFTAGGTTTWPEAVSELIWSKEVLLSLPGAFWALSSIHQAAEPAAD